MANVLGDLFIGVGLDSTMALKGLTALKESLKKTSSSFQVYTDTIKKTTSSVTALSEKEKARVRHIDSLINKNKSLINVYKERIKVTKSEPKIRRTESSISSAKGSILKASVLKEKLIAQERQQQKAIANTNIKILAQKKLTNSLSLSIQNLGKQQNSKLIQDKLQKNSLQKLKNAIKGVTGATQQRIVGLNLLKVNNSAITISNKHVVQSLMNLSSKTDMAKQKLKGFATTMKIASRSGKTFASRMTHVGQRMSSVGRQLSLYVSLPAQIATAFSVNAFAKFDTSMRNVNTIARESETQLTATSKEVLELSRSLGESPTGLADALYEINSASFKGKDAMVLLKQSTKAGIAGISTTKAAADTLTSVLNAYTMKVSEATNISDIMFKTIERGKITFSDIAQHMGTVVSTAASAKVPFGELMSAIALMTRGGIPPAEAFTALNKTMLNMIANKAPLVELFKKVGFETSSSALSTLGLGKAMKVIEEATGGAGDQINALGFDIRAFKAVAALTKNGMRDFQNDLDNIANSSNNAGATQRAQEEQMKSFGRTLKKFKTELTLLGIELGRNIAPVLKKLLGVITSLSSSWRNANSLLKTMTGYTILFFAVIGPAVFVLGKLTMAYGALTKAMIAYKASTIAGKAATIGLTAKLGLMTATAILAYETTRILAKELGWEDYVAKNSALIGWLSGLNKAQADALITQKKLNTANEKANKIFLSKRDEIKEAKELLEVKKEMSLYEKLLAKFNAPLSSENLKTQSKINEMIKEGEKAEEVARFSKLTFSQKVADITQRGLEAEKQIRLAIMNQDKKAELEAILRAETLGNKKDILLRKGKEAQKSARTSLEEKLKSYALDKMNIEEKITEIIKRRNALVQDAQDALLSQAEKFDIMGKIVDASSKLKSLLNQKMKANSTPSDGALSRAYLVGSVEAVNAKNVNTVKEREERANAKERAKQSKIMESIDEAVKSIQAKIETPSYGEVIPANF